MAEMDREYGRKSSKGFTAWERKEPGKNTAENPGRRKFSDIRFDWKEIREHLGMDKLLLIFLAGILLLLSSVPFGKKEESSGSDGQQGGSGVYDSGGSGGSAAGSGDGGSAGYAAQLEERLEAVLLSVDGVGKVQVMITLKDNGEKLLQSDTVRERSNTSETDSSGGSRNVQEGREEYSTVILNEGTGDSPYITRETTPEIEGVLVVAQGAGSASVKTEIYEAVQALFNVPIHKIKVLKGVLEN